MSERVWTEDQKKAIEVTGRNILVSAAAGSGKTASLAERVVRKITAKQNPVDADKLLIVTFTNAAASEMRDRISSLLSNLIEKNPWDMNLKRQQSLLKYASICTIHSFCLNIVRDNFYKLDISPNFRIADDNEISILEERAMESVLGKFYEKGEDSFYSVVENFSNEKDDSGLISTIRKIYKFIGSCPFPEYWLEETAQMYKNISKIDTTLWGETHFEYVESALNCCEYMIINAMSLINSDEILKESYFNVLSSELSGIQAIKSSLKEKSWDKIKKETENFKRGRRGRLSEEYKEDIYVLLIDGIRDYVKKSIDKVKKYFVFSETTCQKEQHKIGIIVETLFNITNEFIKELSLMKREKNILEFNDLEHFMIKLLTKKEQLKEETQQKNINGKNLVKIQRSETAEEISLNFEEIMVDEYQDTNEAQELIFKILSENKKNLFMVGDIKQSIYGFRQAKPEIFMNKKEKYELYDEKVKDKKLKDEKSPCKIILGKNFRSRRGIIEAVNFMFEKLMSKKIGGVEYNDEEALSFGAYDKYCQKRHKKVATEEENEAEVIFEILENSDGESNEKAEAEKISKIIADMIKNRYMIKDGNIERPVTYKDFCILLRSANKYASVYAKELSSRGIPAWSDSTGKFFKASEVSVIMSLLRVIDNPTQDISLISVLLSPIFGFTLDDLSKISLNKINGNKADMSKMDSDIINNDTINETSLNNLNKYGDSLYFAMKSRAEEGDSKCENFLKKLETYRRLCSIMSVEKLINYIYEDTGYNFMALSMTNGELRLANLRLLAEYAGKYDQVAYRGLSGFIEFADRLQEKGADFSAARTVSEVSDVVKIMSIHRSKGLEFPICIIARCSGRFNKEKGDVLIHEKLGLGIMLKDETGSVRYPNFIRNGINLKVDEEEISEELRVLYVAMTRAKEKLIFMICIKDLEKSVINSLTGISNEGGINPYVIRNALSFSDWALSCALLSNQSREIYKYTKLKDPGYKVQNLNSFKINISKVEIEKDSEYEEKKEKEKCAEKEKDESSDKKITEEFKHNDIPPLSPKIIERFDFKYPYEDIYKTPAKISASRLAHEEVGNRYIAVSRPTFMSEKSVTPAEKGTAFHEFLHFADYSSALKDFDSHLKYLKEKKFLTPGQAEAIDKKSVFNFLRGDLGQRIIKSENVLREYRFTVGIPTREITHPNFSKDEDKILIQGAIDCVFEEKDGFVIVDYKTDKVKNLIELKSRYSKQLNIYKYAFEICEGLKVRELLIYSLTIGKWIEV